MEIDESSSKEKHQEVSQLEEEEDEEMTIKKVLNHKVNYLLLL